MNEEFVKIQLCHSFHAETLNVLCTETLIDYLTLSSSQ